MRYLLGGLLGLCASLAGAQTLSEGARSADILIIGETHDNPRHHEAQAALVSQAGPAALVFEMLEASQAKAANAARGADQEALARILDWEASGWPDFSMYYPIFSAAGDAVIYGASVPRDLAREAMEQGVEVSFGDAADLFGLDHPLPKSQQAKREQIQMAAHCDALPEHMLPGMVAIQRLRDAELARVAILAHADTGGPVVVITGNGHARLDWGVPAYLSRAAPYLSVWSIMQSELGVIPNGGAHEILDAAAPDREDPCAAFR